MKKKTVLTTLGILFCLSLGAFGAVQTEMIEVAKNSVQIEVNGKEAPVENMIYKGVTYVPVSFIARELGAQVDWDGQTRTVRIANAPSPKPSDSLPVQPPAPPATEPTTEEPKKDIRAEMQYQIRNVDFSTQVVYVDRNYNLLSTLINSTPYTLLYAEAKYYDYTEGKYYTAAWSNIDPQRTGEQRRFELKESSTPRKIRMVERRLIFYDGNEQQQFFDSFYENWKNEN